MDRAFRYAPCCTWNRALRCRPPPRRRGSPDGDSSDGTDGEDDVVDEEGAVEEEDATDEEGATTEPVPRQRVLDHALCTLSPSTGVSPAAVATTLGDCRGGFQEQTNTPRVGQATARWLPRHHSHTWAR